uniref:protein-serine/threonine phosphatase n=1 Tax=Entomoneis paludosa TaxID=265537 RepID=A0A7S2YG96_9STRA|mmetsp:Transcript_31663/g.66132  ORF Transcript_31663/g.66132 Transcript_31663/m.66132 type:complete len:467 (+) Transcript_31663:244-1644(+)
MVEETATTTTPATPSEEEATSSSTVDQITSLKDLGNEELQKGHYLKAIDYYSQGLELEPNHAVLLSNRAFVYIKIENYGLALQDAEASIQLDQTYAKAYYRRASANLALNHYKLARKDLKQVCLLKPKDRNARAKLQACEKAIKEEAFLKAIEAEHTAPLSQTYDPTTLVVNPKTYAGPQYTTTLPEGIDDEALLFQPGQLPRSFVMECIEWMRNEKQVHKRYVARVLLACKPLMEATPSLMHIPIPKQGPKEDMKPRLTVCGDTHGQFYDLLHIFENVNDGYPSATNPYVFNGDFVDRGSFSLEVILTLLLFKLNDPTSIYLTRGNHETKNMNKIYGFEGEVKAKYDDPIFQLFLEVFEWLPLAAVVEHAVFITHGGLPSDEPDSITTLEQISRIPRGMEPPESGLMSDLLWSDPQPFPGKSPSKRGVGFAFGPGTYEWFCSVEMEDALSFLFPSQIRLLLVSPL